jgi:hypothetical protein
MRLFFAYHLWPSRLLFIDQFSRSIVVLAVVYMKRHSRPPPAARVSYYNDYVNYNNVMVIPRCLIGEIPSLQPTLHPLNVGESRMDFGYIVTHRLQR